MSYVYPLNRELSAIGPVKVARVASARAGFEIMPMRNVNSGIIAWTQRDNYFGLQQLRGLDGAPQHVNPVGNNMYSYTPGVYGEFMTITETELTLRAGSVTTDTPIDVTDLVTSRQDQLIVRELDRIEQIIWTLLTTGTFSISTPTGTGGNAVVFTDTFVVQTYTRFVDWDTAATAKPLADFREVALLGAGKGLNFGPSARAYMNRVTANKLLSVTNTSDIGGKLVNGGNTVTNTLADMTRLMVQQDTPEVRIYDEGYYNDSNVFTRFIPTDIVVVVGARSDGDKIGEYVMTRNANNPGMTPGSYDYVVDRINGTNGEKRTPPNMEVHRGHSGGPVLYHAGGVVVMIV